MNLQKMMQQAQAMQNKMAEMQSALELQEFEGSAGGEVVKVVLTGKGVAKSVRIDTSLLNEADKETLEDLVVAAINDAKNKADGAAAAEMGKMTSGLALPPGFKLPF